MCTSQLAGSEPLYEASALLTCYVPLIDPYRGTQPFGASDSVVESSVVTSFRLLLLQGHSDAFCS
jgi:hypothetical protein